MIKKIAKLSIPIILVIFLINNVIAPDSEDEVFLSNLSFSEPTPNLGDTILVNVTITNNRNISLVDTYIQFIINDRLIENRTNITLEPFQSKSITFKWYIEESSISNSTTEILIKLNGITQITRSIKSGRPNNQKDNTLLPGIEYILYLIIISFIIIASIIMFKKK
jgi:hypothetical protein